MDRIEVGEICDFIFIDGFFTSVINGEHRLQRMQHNFIARLSTLNASNPKLYKYLQDI